MKMMCIKGRQHPSHTGIVAGQVYDVEIHNWCCRPCAFAAGSVFVRDMKLICIYCRKVHKNVKQVPWGTFRFVPWQDQGITQEEVNQLYQPKEHQDETV